MDAEIELELAQGGLCCMMGNIGAIAGATGGAAAVAGLGGAVGSLGGGVTAPFQDGAGGGGSGSAHDGHAHPRCRLYSPSQVSGISGNQENDRYTFTLNMLIGAL